MAYYTSRSRILDHLSLSNLTHQLEFLHMGGCYSELNPKYTVANPDIAGIGVIASFIASAAIVILLFALSEATSILMQDRTSIPPHVSPPRGLGERVLFQCRRLTSSRWLMKVNNALPKVVFVLGSQQLVIGTLIMASAIYLRNQMRISTYHLQLSADLGWLCSNAYILSSLVLRRACSTNNGAPTPTGRPPVRLPRFSILWHTVCVPVLVGFLVYAAALSGTWKSEPVPNDRVVSTSGLEFDYSSGFVLRRGFTNRNWTQVSIPQRPRHLFFQWVTYIANIVFVALAYLATCVTLVRPTFNIAQVISHLKGCQRSTPQHRMIKRILDVFINTAVKVVIVLLTIIASDAFHILFHISSFVVAAGSTIRDRNSMHKHPVYGRNVEEENRFGFGQVFSLLLLIFPLITLGEALF
ncbi:hypothetical protein BKA66DRAFT_122556 [Pyrenochaeta sp. MPI-SDFR-AT-0127]|nr:hypothetical protein BKA66DRAFT_122556 [Pyrenochaeta sp. MPI-SDFR-AT-0127]